VDVEIAPGALVVPDWTKPSLAEARQRASDLAHLNAFVSMTDEQGDGPVVAVKDLVDVRGAMTTGGGTILRQEEARADAPVVARLRLHGCVIVGKTNLHEWAFGATSQNPHYGDVRNPHDVARVAGGSSGGSAVAVATGMCAFAIGTDTGGSIRIPAALCGVVGFKPTYGTIDTAGVIPLARSLDTLGPLALDVASATMALELMSGSSIFSVAEQRAGPPMIGAVDGWSDDLDAETLLAWEFCTQGLPRVELPDRASLSDPALTILYVEAAAYHRKWLDEFEDSYAADVLEKLRFGLAIPTRHYESAKALQLPSRQAVEAAMQGYDAVLVPGTACVAPHPDDPAAREQLTRFTRPFNMTGQPVVTLPAPTSGLPVGVQVVGHHGRDAELAHVAAWLERAWREKAGPEPKSDA
jgi:aspartyl-tRNA(Asn)/glutamyl-tRNA(Gln) amidotransferase subunit A